MDRYDSDPLTRDISPENKEQRRPLSRRALLKWGALGVAASTLALLEAKSLLPDRLPLSPPTNLPQIQFDINNHLPPAQTIDGVLFRFGPVHTLFLTARLKRMPTMMDQQTLANALNTIEAAYPFSPSGVFTFLSYGLPYFKRLPSSLVAAHMPRLLSDTTRFALEEAVPAPTDVSAKNPGSSKLHFNVPVSIESNDVLFTIRSDSLANIQSVVAWLRGSNSLNGQFLLSPNFQTLFTFTSSRLMFLQKGMPYALARSHALPYFGFINPESPMWMGFADQQVAGSGPAAITTFQGNASASFTTTKTDDYFFNGSIQHLSHVILDLQQYYSAGPYIERCQYMFRSNPVPSTGNSNQFSKGGGPAYLANTFHGANDALDNAQGNKTHQNVHRLGHLTALQRSSRAADSTPIHIRMDGPGFDALDVPDGSQQPKLQFTMFFPTADFFATLRVNQASLDLVQHNNISDKFNGIERFMTTTRRQNFLVPPRDHRAFPLLELM